MLQVDYFDTKIAGPLFPTITENIIALHHLIQSRIFAEINKNVPIELSPKLTQAFYLPKDIQQRAFFDVGKATAAHIHFKRAFIEKNIDLYPQLKPLLEKSSENPDQAQFTPAVTNEFMTNYAWDELIDSLLNHSHPARLLAVKARELLTIYCDALERLEENPVQLTFKIKQSHKEGVTRVREYIENNIAVHHPYNKLVRIAQMNECTMKRVFKVMYKKSIYQYLKEIRMQFAKDKLLHTRMPIVDIAEKCGYSDVAHFNELFKNTFKVSPSEMRKGK